MKVWIAAVSHDHGLSVYAAETEVGARNHLYEYVKEWWEDVTEGGEVPLRCPRDQDRAISLYFNNHPRGEHYEMDEIEVTP